jgi:hypothetical protein
MAKRAAGPAFIGLGWLAAIGRTGDGRWGGVAAKIRSTA